MALKKLSGPQAPTERKRSFPICSCKNLISAQMRAFNQKSFSATSKSQNFLEIKTGCAGVGVVGEDGGQGGFWECVRATYLLQRVGKSNDSRPQQCGCEECTGGGRLTIGGFSEKGVTESHLQLTFHLSYGTVPLRSMRSWRWGRR